MIRQSVLAEIKAGLSNNEYFNTQDFSVEVGRGEKSAEVTITYNYEPQYRMLVSIPPNKTSMSTSYGSGEDFLITTREVPGEINQVETNRYGGKVEFLRGLNQWLIRIQEELRAVPLHREIDEQRVQLERLAEQFQDLPDEYFTRVEAQLLREKLEELEAKLVENIKTTGVQQARADYQIKALHNDVEVLKAQLEVLKKSSWAKSLGVRLLEWAKDPTNRKLLSSGAEVAKGLLMDSGDRSS